MRRMSCLVWLCLSFVFWLYFDRCCLDTGETNPSNSVLDRLSRRKLSLSPSIRHSRTQTHNAQAAPNGELMIAVYDEAAPRPSPLLLKHEAEEEEGEAAELVDGASSAHSFPRFPRVIFNRTFHVAPLFWIANQNIKDSPPPPPPSPPSAAYSTAVTSRTIVDAASVPALAPQLFVSFLKADCDSCHHPACWLRPRRRGERQVESRGTKRATMSLARRQQAVVAAAFPRPRQQPNPSSLHPRLLPLLLPPLPPRQLSSPTASSRRPPTNPSGP